MTSKTQFGRPLSRSICRMLTLALIAAGPALSAQHYKVIHQFTGAVDGAGPYGDLVMDPAGNLYGTTTVNGPQNCGNLVCGGTVFELSKVSGGWKRTVLHSFAGADGAYPQAGMVLDSAGNLYGTTSLGGVGCQNGCGVLFELSPSTSGTWTYTILRKFTDTDNNGTSPNGNLIIDASGNLYGTTSQGGDFNTGGGNGCGVVFELTNGTSGWTETVLHTFSGADGCLSHGGVIFDGAGNLYGTTTDGGNISSNNCLPTLGCGTVFKLSPTSGGWTETVLYKFTGSIDGNQPNGSLVLDGSGNLYGVTTSGGTDSGCSTVAPFGCGLVFKLSSSSSGWSETVIHTFQRTVNNAAGYGGGLPHSNLTFDSAGNLYGTASAGGRGFGVVFKLSPDSNPQGWKEHVVRAFYGSTDGSNPYSGVIFDAAGNLFGTTVSGGNTSICSGFCGVVFEITP